MVSARTDRILTSIENRVLTIQFNRIDKKNALTGEMYNTVSDELARANSDPQIRAVILTGTGDSFTSGNDIEDFVKRDPDNAERPASRFLDTISTFSKPIIAGVNGLAVGIGVTMLLHCDIVFASESASFRVPFVDLGLVPEAASSLLLPRLAGYHRAASLFLCGEILDARAASAMGLVQSVHPGGELLSQLEKTARLLASKPPSALRLTKALMKSETNAVSSRMVEERMVEERMFFEAQLASAEAAEAMSAFRQKRKPDFSSFS
jgi:enoyl-CoA hydratase/carnithine racemase